MTVSATKLLIKFILASCYQAHQEHLIYSRNRYRRNRVRVQAQNRLCKMRRGHLWNITKAAKRKIQAKNREDLWTTVCAECRQTVLCKHAVIIRHKWRNGHFSLCKSCNHETAFFDWDLFTRTYNRCRSRATGYLETRHLFLYDQEALSPEPDATETYRTLENFKDLNIDLSFLDPWQRQVIQLRFFEDFTLGQAAKKLRLSRERIRQLQIEAIKILREHAKVLQATAFIDAKLLHYIKRQRLLNCFSSDYEK